MSSRIAASGLRPCCCRHAWLESGSALGDPGRPGLGLGYLRACRYDLYWARKTAGSFFGKAATPRGGRGRGGGGGGGGGRGDDAAVAVSRVSAAAAAAAAGESESRVSSDATCPAGAARATARTAGRGAGSSSYSKLSPAPRKRAEYVMSCYHMPRLARRCARHCRLSHRSPTYSSVHRDGATAQLTAYPLTRSPAATPSGAPTSYSTPSQLTASGSPGRTPGGMVSSTRT